MLGIGFAYAFATPLVAYADPPGDPAAVTNDQGMWRDKNGDPIILRKTLEISYQVPGDDRHAGENAVIQRGEQWIMR